MAVSNAAPVNTQLIRDANYIANVALPTGAALANTSGLDMISSVPFSTTRYVVVQVLTSAAAGANNKNVNVRLQWSADNIGNWTNVSWLANPLLQNVDNNGGGFSTNSVNVSIATPDSGSINRYIRAQAQSEANGGASNNGTLTLQFLM